MDRKDSSIKKRPISKGKLGRHRQRGLFLHDLYMESLDILMPLQDKRLSYVCVSQY